MAQSLFLLCLQIWFMHNCVLNGLGYVTVLVTSSNLLLSSNQQFGAEPLFIFIHWRHWPMMERLCNVHMG